MSLNKFTRSDNYLNKQYLNVGCNDVKCTTLEVEGNSVVGVSYGVYEPLVTFVTGATAINTEAVYTLIGNKTQAVLDCSLKFTAVVTTSSNLYIIRIPLPVGMTNYNTNNCIAVGGITNLNSAKSYYSATEVAQVTGESTLTLIFQSTTTTLLPTADGTKVSTLNFKCSVVQA
jgi:hypothetical protein